MKHNLNSTHEEIESMSNLVGNQELHESMSNLVGNEELHKSSGGHNLEDKEMIESMNNQYDGEDNVESFEGETPQKVNIILKNNPWSILVSFFWTLISFFAIFLSFKCNKGFNFGHFLAACCCAPFYIAIILGTSWNKCFS